MSWQPLKWFSDWMGSSSVPEQKKAEAAALFNKAFENSEVGKLMTLELKNTLSKPFSQQLAEARQSGELQNSIARSAGQNNLEFTRGHADVIGGLNTTNTDLRIKQGSAATDDQIRLLREKMGLLGGESAAMRAHELAVMDKQSADSAANRTHEARNDGFNKVMGVGDLLARIGGAAMLMMS